MSSPGSRRNAIPACKMLRMRSYPRERNSRPDRLARVAVSGGGANCGRAPAALPGAAYFSSVIFAAQSVGATSAPPGNGGSASAPLASEASIAAGPHSPVRVSYHANL